MDVEPLCLEGSSGPSTWEEGESSVRGFWKIAKENNLRAIFFLHPEAILAQKALFQALAAEGAELGLHLHPAKYSAFKYGRKKFFKDFGALTVSEMVEILKECIVIFQDAFGYPPRFIRPGTFSANDAMFPTLLKMGIDAGSCSAPNRVAPQKCAVWAGAPLDPHRADLEFRQRMGTSEFVNVPISVDTSRLLTTPNGVVMHPDLRPDIDWLEEYNLSYLYIARNIVGQLLERKPAVPIIMSVTHNQYRYEDDKDPVTVRLRQSLEAIFEATKERNIAIACTTFEEIIDRVRAIPVIGESARLVAGIF